MRLAVISDIHGNLAALEAVLADIKARGVDRTVNLGDCVTSPLWPKETFEALEALSLPTVRGNHDRWIEEFPDDKLSSAGLFARNALTAEQRLALHSLPSQIRLDDGILACHGTPDNDTTCLLEETLDDGRFVPARRDVLAMRLASEPTARVVLCGHSHRQAVTDLMTVWFSIQGALVARSSQTFPLPQTWNTARRTRDMQSSRSDKGAGRPNSWPSNTIGTPHRPVPSPTTTRNGRGPYRRDMSNSCWHRST
jgi:predicted phosphodiesterase